ncbi:antibiotic biosynthesis monooxygenase [Paraglaciecola sp. MB-3u-78]|uniref:antibiotic biosynthesis monooxygenase n=1 Tax=Paraglaciecola sp. MB-3u-78 TaxID=2058332 RepID=UPI000C34B2F9|nr:antibiotic biosynthesis monooxygenase [Paraglaciecola sp. MB-3u-78]PKG98544.1 antibiotic biosynthesis monooxygenase [Paraglaciecola sp. MB-3u-78]
MKDKAGTLSLSHGKNDICEPGDEGPVTVSIARKIKAGYENEYEIWISGVIEAASGYNGHMGSNVLRPAPSTDDEYVIIYRFDTYANCMKWEQSDLRQQWLDKLEAMVEGESTTRRGTGLEFWFDLPELPLNKKPSAHKMALVLIIVVYLLVMAINVIFQPLFEGMNIWLRSLVVVVGQVLLLTYIVMPWVTRLLKGWLFKD